ncbi:MAG TPA: hypothetical protein VFE61_20820 [Candidatus Sulfotelmatobacter sp.]|jgi:hypothetical protein|nr:hypothetical protein [Candidatus Sulfotelmatobacter sp.]
MNTATLHLVKMKLGRPGSLLRLRQPAMPYCRIIRMKRISVE